MDDRCHCVIGTSLQIQRKMKLIDNWSYETWRIRIQRRVDTVTGELLEPANDSSIFYLSISEKRY
jgi:hypothetical protein